MAKSAKSKTTKATPQKKVVKKIEPKKAEQKKVEKKKETKKVENKKVSEPIPEAINEVVYLTDEQFDEKYKVATTECFQEGEPVYTKERYGELWMAKQVNQIGVVSVDSAAFNDLVYRGQAYIKK